MALKTKEFYRSSDQDIWMLAWEPRAEHLFVRHEAGETFHIDLGSFLKAKGSSVEQKALLRLIATLVKDNDETSEKR